MPTPTQQAAHDRAINDWYEAQPESTLRHWLDQLGEDATPRQVWQAAHDAAETQADETAPEAPSAFIHHPRQAIVSSTPGHCGTRTFGLATKIKPLFGSSDAKLTVHRYAYNDEATIGFEIANATINFGAMVGPGNLRAIAAQLIDAAHDIETNPACDIALTLQDHPGEAA